MTRVDADIAALKELHTALSRYAHAQREILARAGEQAQDALAALDERASRCRDELRDAELDDRGGSGRDAAERYERARRWLHRVDEQFSVYLAAAERFRLLMEEGVPRAQATLAELIARLEATRATGTAAAGPVVGGGVAGWAPRGSGDRP